MREGVGKKEAKARDADDQGKRLSGLGVARGDSEVSGHVCDDSSCLEGV